MKKLVLSAVVGLFFVIAAQAQVQLIWDAPTNNVDGSVCTNLVAYKLYGGNVSGTYTTNWVISSATNMTTIATATLPKYFAVAAVNDWGIESALSNEILLASTVPASPQRLRRIAYEFVGGKIVVTVE